MLVNPRQTLLRAASARIAYANELLTPVYSPDSETHLFWLKNRCSMACDLLTSTLDLLRVAGTKQ